jgi:hypothetical protein
MNSYLKSIKLPSSLEVIEGSAFRGVVLRSVSISKGNSLYRIHQTFLQDISGRSIFRHFGKCHSVVIPSFVTILCKASFAWCKSLTWVEFEDDSQLQEIGELAFSETGLTNISIPKFVTEMHKTAFLKCLSLRTVIFQNTSNDELIKSFKRQSRRIVLKYLDLSGFAEFKIQTRQEWTRAHTAWGMKGPEVFVRYDEEFEVDDWRVDDGDRGPSSSDNSYDD